MRPVRGFFRNDTVPRPAVTIGPMRVHWRSYRRGKGTRPGRKISLVALKMLALRRIFRIEKNSFDNVIDKVEGPGELR